MVSIHAGFRDFAGTTTYGFIFPVKNEGNGSSISGGNIGYGYDVDSETLNIYVLPYYSDAPLNGISMSYVDRREIYHLEQLKMNSELINQKKYFASNAFGATVVVDEKKWMRYGVAARHINFLHFNRSTYYLSPEPLVRIKMKKSDAITELSMLKALVVVKLSDPYVGYNYMRDKPTIDSPYDSSIQEKFLIGNVLGIIMYSGKSGEIFSRFPENYGKVNLLHEGGRQVELK